MANILDYIYWRGDLSFDNDSFNNVDNLILAELSYLDFNNSVATYPSKELITLKDATNKMFSLIKKEDIKLGFVIPYDVVTLLDKASSSKRFSNIYMSNYINVINKSKSCQFSAVCFHLNDDLIYVAYRGTDDTLIGWQENIDLVCKFPVKAQELACDYLNNIANMFPNAKLYVGGHSKGGNLATYASIYCDDEIKKRIKCVYDNDGPGFMVGAISEDKFNLIKSKIKKIIPVDSVVGMLFESKYGKLSVVKSTYKGVNQHDGFSWQLKVTNFDKAKDVTNNSKKLKESIDNMIARLTLKERKDLASDVYTYLSSGELNTLTEAKKNSFSTLRQINKISHKNRKIFNEFIFYFIKYKEF